MGSVGHMPNILENLCLSASTKCFNSTDLPLHLLAIRPIVLSTIEKLFINIIFLENIILFFQQLYYFYKQILKPPYMIIMGFLVGIV